MVRISVFVVLLFGISWTLGYAIRPAEPTLWGVLAPLLAMVWTPTVLAVVFVLAQGGVLELRRELHSRLSRSPDFTKWLVIAVAASSGISAVAVLAARSAGEGRPFTPAGAIPFALGLQVITGALGEELGWRGYLLPRLAKHLGRLRAGWLMAGLWALWHLPAYYTPGMPHQQMPMLWSLLFTTCFGVLLAFLFFRAGQSILVTIGAHLTLNVASALQGIAFSSLTYWAVIAVLSGLTALAVSLVRWNSQPGDVTGESPSR